VETNNEEIGPGGGGGGGKEGAGERFESENKPRRKTFRYRSGGTMGEKQRGEKGG